MYSSYKTVLRRKNFFILEKHPNLCEKYDGGVFSYITIIWMDKRTWNAGMNQIVTNVRNGIVISEKDYKIYVKEFSWTT